jgi:2'-hydroxyisoflavone reductase
MDVLRGREWDAVVDTSGYVPVVVGRGAKLLADAVGHYVFVSSISAYADPLPDGYDESAPLHGEPRSEQVMEEYGPLKAACERTVEEVLPGRSASIRAGLIVGPHDPTDRFTYWAQRGARGGDMLAPGDPRRAVQLVDARDLASWMIDMLERRAGGVFNATGPVPPATMADVVDAVVRAGGASARPIWVDDRFLLEHDVGEWMELPLWIASPDHAGLMRVDVSRAVAAGLRFRPLLETARDTLAWASARGDRRVAKPGVQLGAAGLDPTRERELLAAWSARDA